MEAIHFNLNDISDQISLLAAVRSNDIHTVTELLEKGQEESTLASGLCWASRLGYLPLVVLLLAHGADPNSRVWGGFTPLLWATLFSGDVDVVTHLVDCGTEVNARSFKRKQSSLHAAVIKGDHRMVGVLIELGSDLDAQDYLFKTPLLLAVQRNLTECVKILLLNNCSVNLAGFVNGTRLSPLLVALLQNNLEITKMLILAGAKFEQTTIYQSYTLMQYYRTVEDHLNFEIRPVYLKQLCRVSIRELLKPQFLHKLRQIELPNVMKEFLGLDELNRIC